MPVSSLYCCSRFPAMRKNAKLVAVTIAASRTAKTRAADMRPGPVDVGYTEKKYSSSSASTAKRGIGSQRRILGSRRWRSPAC